MESELVRRAVAPRPAATETRERHQRHARVRSLQVGEREPELLHHARTEIFDDQLGTAHKIEHPLAIVRVAHVGDDAAFAGVEKHEHRPVLPLADRGA